MVGKPIRVQWKGGKSYVGRVTEFNEDDGKHKVEYKDRETVKWYNLGSKKYSELTEEEFGKS